MIRVPWEVAWTMIEWCSETTRVFLYYPFVMRYSSPVRISTKVGKGRGKVKGSRGYGRTNCNSLLIMSGFVLDRSVRIMHFGILDQLGGTRYAGGPADEHNGTTTTPSCYPD